MLAVTGYIIQAFFRLPGAIDLDGTTFQSIPNGVAAVGAISSFGWLQIVASIGKNEVSSIIMCSIVYLIGLYELFEKKKGSGSSLDGKTREEKDLEISTSVPPSC